MITFVMISCIDYGAFNTNIKQEENLALYELFSNPNNGEFMMQFGFNKEINAKLFIKDMTGKNVWNTSLTNQFVVIAFPIDLLDN